MENPLSQTNNASTSFKQKLALILLPSLLLFGLAEGATRLYVWKYYGHANAGMRWEFGYEPYLMVKKKGLQYRKHPPKGDKFRVLILGGSTAEQSGTEAWREAFSKYTDKEVEVINQGAGGYILNQERIMFVLYGIKLDPDLVVSLDGVNDFVVANKTGRPGILYQSDFIKIAVDHPIRNAFFSVLKKSQFVNSLNKLRERKVERDAQINPELGKVTMDHCLEGWQSIATICHGLEVPYLMALQPYIQLRKTRTTKEEQMASNYDYRKTSMASMFTETAERMASTTFPGKTYVIDATKAFDDIANDVTLFKDEVHVTDQGDMIMAEFIARAAHSQGLSLSGTAAVEEDPLDATSLDQ